MKMSTRGRYGLRVMIELAVHHGQGPTLVDTLAERQDLSANYIHLLMPALKTAGLVRAIRGPRGGFELTRPPAEITALQVVEALEGRVAPLDCTLDGTCCARSDRCPAREVWSEVALAVDRVLSGRTLADLADRYRALQSPPHSYDI